MISLRTRITNNNFVFTPSAAFNPTKYGTISMWLKADALVGFSNNDPVGTWLDSSGNGNSVTQPTGSLRPLYKTNVINALPTLYFDGTDDGMNSTLDIADGTNFSIFVVYNMNPTSAGGHRVIQGLYNNWLIGPYDNFHKLYNGAFVNGPALTTSFVYSTVISDLSTVESLRVNGSLRGSNGNITGPGIVCLGATGGFAETLAGNIAEVLVYSSVASGSSITAVEGYLTNKYGL